MIELMKELMLLKAITVKNVTIICHYWHFNDGLKFQKSICNSCHNLLMLCLKSSDFTIITVKGIDHRCIIHDIRRSYAISLL